MIALIRGELSKTLTTRTMWAFLAGGVAFSALNAVVVAAASGTLDSVDEKREAVSSLPVLLLVWALVGAAGEYRHRTAAPAALVARHGRELLLAARFTAYAVTGLVLGAAVSAASVAVALPLLERHPGPDLGAADLRSAVAGNLAACVLSALLGAAVGALVRNQVVGVVVVLVVNFAVVPLVAAADEALGNYTPFGAAAILSGMTHNTTLTTAAAGAVLAAWTAVVVVAVLAGERRRDLA